MRRIAIVMVVLSLGVGLHLLGRRVFGDTASGFVAFTERKTILRYDGVTENHRTESVTYAMRNDGSRVEVTESVDGKARNLRIVVDLIAGKRVTVDPITRSTITYKLSPEEEADLRSEVTPACGTASGAVKDWVTGYTVLTKADNWTAGDRDIQDQFLVAPNLNCAPLARTTIVRQKGVIIGRNIERADQVSVGEPDPALFQIPSDFKERTPSEYFAERARLSGKPCPTCMAASARELDRAYKSRRPKAATSPGPLEQ